MKASFVSTSVPYVNARPHIGFALELVQADVIARLERLKGNDTFLLTGTDDNALKNVRVATELGVTPKELCDRNAEAFTALTKALDISHGNFIRTSSQAHHLGVSKFWKACRKDDIFLKPYQGLYCIGCEDFYIEEDLKDGRCPIHETKPELVEETNYFFRLSAYQKELEDLISSRKLKIVPESRRNEALGFIRQGLRDFSISRPRDRSGGWGVPVPGDPSQVIYVWFDALTNYLTGLGYGSGGDDFKQYWGTHSRKLHVIGKDIIRFHAIYWPAILLSARLPLPDTLVVHGFLSIEGQKISKSLENAVNPIPIIERYGADALRYYLLRAIPVGADGDFSQARFNELYSADLANGIGNLVRRLETLCERADFTTCTRPVLDPQRQINEHAETFQFQKCLEILQETISDLNRQIEIARPWELQKEGKNAELQRHLSHWTKVIRSVAAGLKPFIPETAAEIEARFSGTEIRQGEPLFPRL